MSDHNRTTEQSQSTADRHDPETGEIYEDTAETVINDGGGFSALGVETTQFISSKNLKPSANWINDNIVRHGAGHHLVLAQLAGWCNKTARVVSQLPGEKEPSESIKLMGSFKLLPLIDQLTTVESQTAYLPSVWGERVEQAVNDLDRDSDPRARVQMLLTLGCEATGKQGIAYRWTVTNHFPTIDPVIERLEKFAASTRLAIAGNRKTAGKLGPDKTIDAQAEAAD
jgi:hypothetical protein